ncbi:MAG: hypothetical protein J6R31_06825, partial [Rikenellaceae bacterium]|nr:hypothetical protein [Rikenellaceae bacterium]
MKKLLFFVLMSFALLSCKSFIEGINFPSIALPKAKFSYETPAFVGKSVTFTNESLRYDYCEWYCDGVLFCRDYYKATKD